MDRVPGVVYLRQEDAKEFFDAGDRKKENELQPFEEGSLRTEDTHGERTESRRAGAALRMKLDSVTEDSARGRITL